MFDLEKPHRAMLEDPLLVLLQIERDKLSLSIRVFRELARKARANNEKFDDLFQEFISLKTALEIVKAEVKPILCGTAWTCWGPNRDHLNRPYVGQLFAR